MIFDDGVALTFTAQCPACGGIEAFVDGQRVEEPCTTHLIERFRKLPVDVETILWDGSPKRAKAIKEWTLQAERTPGFLLPDDVADGWEDARVWNDQEYAWIPCPVGHRIVKGRLGEFYPISPAAVAETYERVTP